MMLGQDDKRNLDRVVGAAMLYDSVRRRLLDRDADLLTEYGVSIETQEWLRTLEAADLVDFASAVLSGSAPSMLAYRARESAMTPVAEVALRPSAK